MFSIKRPEKPKHALIMFLWFSHDFPRNLGLHINFQGVSFGQFEAIIWSEKTIYWALVTHPEKLKLYFPKVLDFQIPPVALHELVCDICQTADFL